MRTHTTALHAQCENIIKIFEQHGVNGDGNLCDGKRPMPEHAVFAGARLAHQRTA